MRRRPIAALAGLLLAGLLPVGAAADDDKDESGKGRGNEKDDEKRRAPAPPAPTARPPVTSQRAAVPPATSLTTPQGTERLVSGPVQLAGVDGTGAGPVRLDVAGARPNSTYEVQYVPASNPTVGVILGRVQTDAAGRFAGTAPEPMPAIAEPGRRGAFAFRRVS